MEVSQINQTGLRCEKCSRFLNQCEKIYVISGNINVCKDCNDKTPFQDRITDTVHII